MADMKFHFLCAGVLLSFAGAVRAEVVECTEEQRRAAVPSADEIRDHRQTPLPVVSYPHGTRRESWRFALIVRVNTAGRVECYDEPPPDNWDSQPGIEGPRRAIIDALQDWRYAPFVRDGRPVPVVITETLREYEMPGRHREVPEVSPDKVRISLARSMCFGMCPDYRVELFGDGRAAFTGNAYTVVRGLHRYSVDPAKVAALVGRLRNSDVWSARSVYRAPVTDSSTFMLRIQLGKEVREIEDYVGQWIGMPPAIEEFEDAVDEAAGSNDFIHFSTRAIDELQREGFRFNSLEGAKLLSRGVNDSEADDTALARLVELGAPLALPAGTEEMTMSGRAGPPLLKALEFRHAKTVEALLARGALESNGRPSQANLDAAFRAAIGGGDVALVKRIWGVGGEDFRPSMTFEDVVDDYDDSKPKIRKRVDVITLIASGGWGPKTGDFKEIAEFLVSHGSDLRATRAKGGTLLYSAAEAGDLDYLRFLLSKGLDPCAVDNSDMMPIGATNSEEVALLLLNACTDVSKLGPRGYSYRNFAQSNGWYRVLAWLDAHGG